MPTVRQVSWLRERYAYHGAVVMDTRKQQSWQQQERNHRKWTRKHHLAPRFSIRLPDKSPHRLAASTAWRQRTRGDGEMNVQIKYKLNRQPVHKANCCVCGNRIGSPDILAMADFLVVAETSGRPACFCPDCIAAGPEGIRQAREKRPKGRLNTPNGWRTTPKCFGMRRKLSSRLRGDFLEMEGLAERLDAARIEEQRQSDESLRKARDLLEAAKSAFANVKYRVHDSEADCTSTLNAAIDALARALVSSGHAGGVWHHRHDGR